jgi:hypothetical protein
MVEIIENIENPNFLLEAIAELLDGTHHFYIPSYQQAIVGIKSKLKIY